jgi:hypothetical protein
VIGEDDSGRAGDGSHVLDAGKRRIALEQPAREHVMNASHERIGRIVSPPVVRLVQARPHTIDCRGAGRIDLAFERRTDLIARARTLAAEKREDCVDERRPIIWRSDPRPAGATKRTARCR